VPDNAQGSGPEPMFGDSDLNALRAFVGGYLHQDFVAEHKTPATALDVYCREASRKEILELESDLDRFINKTRALGFGDVRELFVRELHSGWAPPNRAALAHLLRMVRAQLIEK
jgi:CdiI immunity protein